MNHKPLIAVTPSYSSERRVHVPPAYLNALRDCGAIGVALPYTEDERILLEYAEDFDGFLFSGGDDVDPVHYGEETHFDSVVIDSERDHFELAFYRAAVRTGKPILGICRGVQLLNVAEGGTLVQHMDGHSQKEKGTVLTQSVRIDADSRFAAITGEISIRTNTFHHQAVKDIAPSLRAVAWAEDGTIEALESATHPFLVGVQWHPEQFYQNEAHAKRLFEAFIAAVQ